MTLYEAVADILDPPPPPPDLATPAGFAEAHSRGRWRRAPHLDLIEQACLEAINEGGRLILSVSVRHGKSEFASRWLPAWYLGTHPDNRVILAGHEARFASTHGRVVRDILAEHGHRFGVKISKEASARNDWGLASPHDGGMYTVGVDGPVIGRGANLMIIDDPVRNYGDAMSPLKRQRAKEWFTGTASTRLEPGAAVILIMARWHQDDLAGFLLSEAPDEWTEVRLPAVADSPDDPLGRPIGAPLWPERFDSAELERRKTATSLALGEAVWLAQYQQAPTTPGGGMFPEERWRFAPTIHLDWEPIRWVRRWDLAATEGGGDWTVGVLIGRRRDGGIVVSDVTRGQWPESEVRSRIASTAASDPPGTTTIVPQDPGQAGKAQAQQMVTMLAGHDARAERETGSKTVRAAGFAAQQQAGLVTLIEAPWNGAFVAELAAFDRGTHDDQVDAAAGGFNALVGARQVGVVDYDNQALRGTR